MDFLEATIERNPELIRKSILMHQEGILPSNTVVIDLDTVKKNAQIIKEAADENNIKLYFMTKQLGRNPEVAKAINQAGIEKAVAVDMEDAQCLIENNIVVGHIGHLVQIPKHAIKYVLSVVKPEVITVFSYEKAKQIATIATDLGIKQELLVRVVSKGDFFYNYQYGGVEEDNLVETVKRINNLRSVKVVGLTSFPCFRLDVKEQEVKALPNMYTLQRSSELLKNKLGIEIKQINAPGDSAAQLMKKYKKLGVTHVEPGNAFTGTTPWHMFKNLPEKPAWIYLTEISHVNSEIGYSIGGGLMSGDTPSGIWTTLYHNHRLYALVGNNPETILERKVCAEHAGYIDYYGTLYPNRKVSFEVGNTVIYGLRNQVFVSRTKVAVVKGIRNRKPSLVGIYDRLGNKINNFNIH